MASVIEYFICHFCLQKYSDQTCLITHLSSCHLKQSNKKLEDNHRLPRLTKTDRELLQLLKLHRSNEKSSCHKSSSSPNFDLPLTLNSIQYSKQKSFDDTSCQTPKSLLKQSNRIIQEDIPLNTNLKTSSSSSALHSYKYSRREQTTFYSSIKRARWKKQNIQLRRTRPNPLIFPNKSYRIHLPTEISSRQRLNTNLNNSFPLIFDPNFHSLVKLSDRSISNSMQTYFHLIHSIASQEFQLIIYSNDHEHQLSYTAYSFLHLLRQTMNDYSLNLQKTMKRNYFQTFNQSIVPNAKTPRIEPVPEIQIESPEQVTTISPSFIPIIEIEQKIEPIEIDEPIIERARIRVRNGSNQTQKSTQKIIPAAKNDENTLAKPTRMSTRLNTVIKTECLPDRKSVV